MNSSLRPFDEVRAALLAAAEPLADFEQVPTAEALGRVLARAQVSGLQVPPLDNSSMDGYAVCTADVAAPGARLRVGQRIPAGSVGHTLERGTAARIFTGAPIPHGADAVVMQELCAVEGGDVLINHVPRVGEWIRRAGEDIALGATVLAAGARLNPQMLGLAASVGCATLPVFRRLRVALFSTGDELVMPGEPLPPGAIYNSNRYVLRGLLEGLGCQVCDLGIVPDSLEATRAALRAAAGGGLQDDLDKLLPLVIEQTSKLEKAYESGQTDLLTVLRARDQRLQLEAAALDAVRDFHLARIRYEAATGKHAPAGAATSFTPEKR